MDAATSARPRLEVLHRAPREASEKPPLLFVHGLGHGAWCWDEHWLPGAAAAGFDAYACSLRGHAGSAGGSRLRRCRLRDYVADVVSVAQSLPSPPVIVGHSLGGLVVAHALTRTPVAAGVLVAPAWPPTGTLWHIGRRHPGDVVRAVAGQTLPLRAEYLFHDLSAGDAARYLSRCGPESPWAQYATLMTRPPRPTDPRLPVLVVATPEDALVPVSDARRAARRLGTVAVLIPGIGHDMMLDRDWERALAVVLRWVDDLVGGGDRSAPGRASTGT